MKNKLSLGILVILCAFALNAYRGDDDPFSAILKRMESYNDKYAQEKVHLHLDKPYYAVGDDIWFKAYVINTLTSKPSQISGALFVELINERDSLKQQLKIPLVMGIGIGDFKLPDSFTEGNYRIRAYTQWMKNGGTEYFFDKTIKIGNSWSNKVFTATSYRYETVDNTQQVNALIKFSGEDGVPYAGGAVSYEIQLSNRSIEKGKGITNAQGEVAISFLNKQPAIYKSGKIIATLTLPDEKKVTKEVLIKSTSDAVDVQFFPEGGNLVENLPNKIGIKAVGANGLGQDVSGSIIDGQGKEITAFSTTHLGMGNFILNPRPGQILSAKVKFKDGSEKVFGLPKPLAQGYVLSTNNTTGNIEIKIMLAPQMIGKGELKLVTQHNGNIYFVTRANSQKPLISASIEKSKLPSGIIQLTLFSPDNVPVAERLVFVNNPTDQINTAVNADKQSYGKKENVSLTLNAIANSKPVEGTFSVSVTNTTAVKPDELNESNILTSLLLTSDIAGYVEKPNYYFLNNEQQTLKDLDDLMLTQGWRRFQWKNVINGIVPPNIHQPEKTLKISGTVVNFGGKPAPKTKVSLYSTSGGFFGVDTLTDANGRFNFDNLTFGDSTKFIVQARTEKGKRNLDIKLDVVSGQLVTKNKNTGDIILNVNEGLSDYLEQSKKYFDQLARSGRLERSIVLKEVNIAEKKNKVVNSSNLNGNGNADNVITADQLQNCVTLSQCLQGRVPGLMISNGIASLLRNRGVPMQIILDGMYVEPEFLDNIIPNDIETIEVLRTIGYTAIYGSRGGGGVLVINTKRGGSGSNSGSRYVPGIVTSSPKGYNAPRTFYSPKYDTPSDQTVPDLRSTIYWNPLITTNANGKAVFSYYNSDEAGTYRVVVEGIDMMGNLARSVFTYTVK
ncbi:MAG: TonB-dependent receptor [Pedobacter sp.]|nr:MAG: TonB-dependent receptor [Pedobacter sp.]